MSTNATKHPTRKTQSNLPERISVPNNKVTDSGTPGDRKIDQVNLPLFGSVPG
jgi:hypothetical protein